MVTKLHALFIGCIGIIKRDERKRERERERKRERKRASERERERMSESERKKIRAVCFNIKEMKRYTC